MMIILSMVLATIMTGVISVALLTIVWLITQKITQATPRVLLHIIRYVYRDEINAINQLCDNLESLGCEITDIRNHRYYSNSFFRHDDSEYRNRRLFSLFGETYGYIDIDVTGEWQLVAILTSDKNKNMRITHEVIQLLPPETINQIICAAQSAYAINKLKYA
jgi:hypothetical protein